MTSFVLEKNRLGKAKLVLEKNRLGKAKLAILH
jgi:hypothetical protein